MTENPCRHCGTVTNALDGVCDYCDTDHFLYTEVILAQIALRDAKAALAAHRDERD